MNVTKPHSGRIDDQQAERSRRQLEQAVGELQKLPAAGMQIVANVSLADGVETPIAHRLGRLPVFVKESCPRGGSSTGRIQEVRATRHDRSKVVVLVATGWGASIVVDVMVM